MAISTIPEVKEEIQTNIATNNNRAITGQVLQDTLIDMLDTVDDVKANTTGYYEGMSVGLADNLISPDLTEDSASWLYRSTAGDQDVSSGFATLQKLEGGTIAWNQRALLPTAGSLANGNGTSVTINSSNEVVITTTQTVTYTYDRGFWFSNALPVRVPADHLVLISCEYNSPVDYTFGWDDNVFGAPASYMIKPYGFKANEWVYNAYIRKTTSSISSFNLLTRVLEQPTVGTVFSCRNIQVFDLTLMFGVDSRVFEALGVNNLTSSGNITTAIKNFKRLFPELYYSYNPGTLISFNPSDIETVGFNQYDNSKQTANIHVLADNKYRIKGTYTGLTYSDGTNVPITDGYFTPDRVDYLTLTGGNSADTCVHLSWSGWRDPVEDYEAYWKQDTDLSWIREIQYQSNPLFPNGLCRAGEAYDEISDGKAIKRVGSVDLGSLTWTYETGNTQFYAPLDSAKPGQSSQFNTNTVCGKYIVNSHAYNLLSSPHIRGVYSNGLLYVIDANYSTAASFKTAMNGVYAYYELATPIVVDLPDGINLNYRMDDFGTEELINTDAAANTPGLCKPTLVEIGYQTNLRDKIRRLDDNYVSFTTDQTETASDSEKQQARRNIDAPDKDGYYAQMHVGLADNLTSPDGVTDNEEFIFRTTAGDQDVSSGYATLEKIEGHTVKWRQIVTNDRKSGTNSSYDTRDNTQSPIISLISGTTVSTSIAVTTPQRISFVDAIPADATSYIIRRNGKNVDFYMLWDSWYDFASVKSHKLYVSINITAVDYTTVGGYKWDNFYIIDLTDAGYPNINTETPTASEVESWLAKNVGYKEYYPYDAGSLLSVDVSGLKTVGFNQWDEEWELGQYSDYTGAFYPEGQRVCSNHTHKIPVVGGQTYFFRINGSFGINVMWFDANDNFLNNYNNVSTWYLPTGNGTLTAPTNAAYIQFYMGSAYGTTYNHDICINLSWSGYRNGEYEPYWTETLNLEFIKSIEYTPEGSETPEKLFPYGLLSVGDVRDEVTATKAIKRVGSVNLGDLTSWSYISNISTFQANTPTDSKANTTNGILAICSKYSIPSTYTSFSSGDNVCLVNSQYYSGGKFVIVRDSNLSTSDIDSQGKISKLNGVMLYYELATPIEIDITPAQNLNYRMDDFGTEEFVSDALTVPQTAAPYPTIQYMDNLRDKIRRMDDNYVSFTVDQTESKTAAEQRQAQENIGLPSVMETKANVSGAYPQLTAGNLIADVETPREFTFDKTGGDGTVVGNGYATMKSVQGNTVVWNQLFNKALYGGTTTQAGITITNNGDGSFTISGTWDGSTALNFILTFQDSQYFTIGHKYLLRGMAKQTSSSAFYIVDTDNNGASDAGSGIIYTATSSTTFRSAFRIRCANNASTGTGSIVATPQLFDLTKMFGSGNEPSVSEFERMFPNQYYPYCEGRLVSLGGYKIKWNQLIQNGNFVDTSAWSNSATSFSVANNTGSVTISTSNTGIQQMLDGFVVGHKYYGCCDVKKDVGIATRAWMDGSTYLFNDAVQRNDFYHYAGIVTAPTTGLVLRPLWYDSNGGSGQVKNVMFIDLTLMFGPGSEPTLEEFEAMFGTQYSPYDAGTEMNVMEKMDLEDDLSVRSTGFNLWDEDWEPGGFTGDGQPADQYTNFVRSKNFCRCLPSTYYYVNLLDGGIFFYDIDKNWVRTNSIYPNGSKLVQTPSTAVYFKVGTSYNTGGIYQNDICVNLSDPSKNGKYEPHIASTQDLSWIYDLEYTPEGSETSEKLFPYGLESVGNAYDEVTQTSATKRVVCVDLKDCDYGRDGSSGFWYVNTTNIPTNLNETNAFVPALIYNGFDKNIQDGKHWYLSGAGYFEVYSSTAQGVQDIRNEFAGVKVWYKSENSISITFDSPKNLGYNVQSGGTEELLPTNPSSANPITAPVVLSVTYPLDAVGTLTNLPSNYISLASMDSFTTALGNFINANISRSWDDTNSKWNFTVQSRS